VAEAAVACRLNSVPPVRAELVPSVRPVPELRLFQFHVIAFAPLSMELVVIAAKMPDSGTELAAPLTVTQFDPSQNSKVLLGETLPPVHCTMPALVALQAAEVAPN
jgi:hypothetical protein